MEIRKTDICSASTVVDTDFIFSTLPTIESRLGLLGSFLTNKYPHSF